MSCETAATISATLPLTSASHYYACYLLLLCSLSLLPLTAASICVRVPQYCINVQGVPKKTSLLNFLVNPNFGQIWAFWANLGNSGQFWAFSAILGILGKSGHYGQFWANLGILGILGKSGPSGQFKVFWANLGKSGHSGQTWAF